MNYINCLTLQAVYKEINMSLFYKEITLLFSSWYPQYIYPCPIFKDIGATWFISTILFCYMVFPIFMMMTQKCTTTKKVFIAIAILFWIQNMIALFTAIWMNERNKVSRNHLFSTIERVSFLL